VCHYFLPFWWDTLVTPLLSFGRGRLLHSVLSLVFQSLIEDPAARFVTSGSRVCLMASQSVFLMNVFSFPRCSHCSMPRSSIPLPNALPGPLWPYPLRGAGMAWQVHCPMMAANSCRDPLSPWACFFSCLWQLKNTGNLYSSWLHLTHYYYTLVFSVTLFSNSFHWQTFLCFWARVLTGMWPSHKHLILWLLASVVSSWAELNYRLKADSL
jgi:hypothetical protein